MEGIKNINEKDLIQEQTLQEKTSTKTDAQIQAEVEAELGAPWIETFS